MSRSQKIGGSFINHHRIWKTVQNIPRGKIATYGQIADLAGLPGRARLVGKALGAVPSNIEVNWHRVLRSTGQIAFSPGSEQANLQRCLLQEEDVVVNNYRINIKVFQWKPDLAELLFKLTF